MGYFKTEALVIRTNPYKERHKFITFFSRYAGKFSGAAYGSRSMKSRFGSSLEPFTHVSLHAFQKNENSIIRVEQTEIIEYYSRLRNDLERIEAALNLVSLIDQTTIEHVKEIGIFDAATAALYAMNEYPSQITPFLLAFEVRLLFESGFAPVLDRCINCGRKTLAPPFQFSFREKGIVCGKCAGIYSESASVSPAVMAFIRDALTRDMRFFANLRLNAAQEKQIQTFLHHLLEDAFERSIRIIRMTPED